MIKKRNWGGVVYPESAPTDWKETLTLKGVAWACSPLHDSDVNPTGEVKKEHYHIIMSFPGPTTDKTVNDIMKELNQPIAIPLESAKGYYRYFTHKDNPEKFQYDEKDIELYNGFDVSDILNNFEVFQHMRTIQKYIMDNNITEYSTLMDMLFCTGQSELWQVASSHTMFFQAYIGSKRNRVKNGVLKALDDSFNLNGEVNIIDTVMETSDIASSPREL